MKVLLVDDDSDFSTLRPMPFDTTASTSLSPPMALRHFDAGKLTNLM